MELYFHDLISEEASLEGLVDQMNLVVQGADELAGDNPVMATRLQRLREQCGRVQRQARILASRTDHLVRKHPYSLAGISLLTGLAVGILLLRLTRRGCDE